MKTIKSIIRIAILLALFSATVYLIFSQPDDYSQSWMDEFIISKVSGAICAIAFAMLYRIWKSDKWIRRYIAWCNKGAKD